ncbi:MAG: CPBP family intramembrane metalloprotease [Chloroflexi bacterium]|nr:CPBP family intramembrane metalloprotease [Chloroflexota bacterium]
MSPTIYPDPRPEPPPEPPDKAPLPPRPEPPLFRSEEVEEEYESPFPEPEAAGHSMISYRGATSDPVFGYLIAVALSIGLMPLIPGNADLRYTVIWMVMAGFAVLAWLLGSMTRIGQETPENLVWGAIFGLIIGVPLLLVGGDTLRQTDQRLFVNMRPGEVLAFLVFVMPLAETLFFRGLLQENRPFWLVGVLASVWSAFVFFPLLDVGRYPAVGLVIGTALALMNLIYSYVRQRNGLAAAWICQIVASFVLLFLPYI